MPFLPNRFATPVPPIAPDLSEDDVPEVHEPEAREENPIQDDIAESPETAVTPLPVGGNRDEPDVRRLLNSYSPVSR